MHRIAASSLPVPSSGNVIGKVVYLVSAFFISSPYLSRAGSSPRRPLLSGKDSFTRTSVGVPCAVSAGIAASRRLYDGAIGTTPSKHLQHTFIHELVHACQIAHSHNLSYLTSALAASGGYDYGPPGPEYSSFNFEQQAQIVSDWWLGRDTDASSTSGGQTKIAKDKSSPYFRYVLDARLGRFGWENW